MGRRGRASACPRSRTGQVIWLAAALLLLAVAVLALWLYETNGAPDGQSAETRQVPPIPPAGGEGLPPAVRNGQAVVQTVADTVAVDSATAPTDADDGNIVYYRRRNDRMEIALSFDDGPHPTYTQEILSILAEYGVPATFFMVGENVLYYPEAAEAVLAAGHEIGNHSYDHRRLTKLNEAGVRSQVSRCEEALASLGEYRPHLLRPPEGAMNATVRRVARAEGYRLILWDIDTRDWAHTPPDTHHPQRAGVGAGRRYHPHARLYRSRQSDTRCSAPAHSRTSGAGVPFRDGQPPDRRLTGAVKPCRTDVNFL